MFSLVFEEHFLSPSHTNSHTHSLASDYSAALAKKQNNKNSVLQVVFLLVLYTNTSNRTRRYQGAALKGA